MLEPMNRIFESTITILFCLVCAATLFAKPIPQGSADPPNVVVFLVDDLGYMDIGANNPDCFYDTPNIDRFAKTGIRFTDGYAANPVCSPTRYSLLTGKYPTRVGATNFFSGTRAEKFKPAPLNDNMPLDEVTLPRALKKNGYATFFAGKWHLGEEKRSQICPEKYVPARPDRDGTTGRQSTCGI